MIDVHCHLNDPCFDQTRSEIIEKTKKEFKYVVDSGASFEGNNRSLELYKNENGFVQTTMGYHPIYGSVETDEQMQIVIDQIVENIDTICAIGEIGLDFSKNHSQEEINRQYHAFETFLKLAVEYDKPVVLHVRESEQQGLEVLKKYPEIPDVIFHSFSGTKTTAMEAVDCGYFLSFSTNALFSKKHKKNLKSVPLENMLTETDSPYLSPVKGENNQPLNLKRTIERIERTKKISFDEIESQTEKNAMKIYNLK